MKGYKGFDKDLKCRGFQYEIGKEYVHDGEIKLCKEGFHFCKKIIEVNNFYSVEAGDVRICEVEATGQVIEGEDKCVTNKIKIIREITKDKMYELANEGKNNRGLGNIGNNNTGNSNTGYSNTGNWNTGDSNTGDNNTGNRNTGDRNTGNYNTGNYNTGNRNTGNYNTGNRNTGNRNTGDWNTGYYNTGDWNTGNYNTGNSNTGNRNTGDRNTGDWNKTNRSAGIFCNEEPKLMMFNKETEMTWKEWRDSEAYYILNRTIKNQWIYYEDMTDEEKEKYPSAKTCGGYLKEIKRADSSKEWWKQLEMHEKATIIQLPNFDLDIFNDIMEMKVTKKEYKELNKWLKEKEETC